MQLHATSARAAAVSAMLTVASALAFAVPPARAIDADSIATEPLTVTRPEERPRTYTAARALPPDPPSADQVQLTRDRYQRMTVSVEVTDAAGQQRPFAFLVDTGAERTVVAHSLVGVLGLVPNGRGTLVGMAGLREVDLVTVAALSMGKRNLYDLSSPVLEAEAIGADGIVGLDGLQGQRVVLDFDNDRMGLGDAAHMGGDRGYDIVIQARRKSGQLIMTDAIIDGVRTALVIDTGSDVSVGNAALQRALSRDHPEQSVELEAVTGQTATAGLGLARHIALGGLTINNTLIAFTDAPPFARLGLNRRPAMLMGMAQLRLFHRVAIDFARRRVLFAVPQDTPR